MTDLPPASAIVGAVEAAFGSDETFEVSPAEVAGALMSLRTQMKVREQSGDEFVAQVLAAAPDLAEIDHATAGEFRASITAILSSPGLAASASATDLLVHHERPFSAARIFSDVRPVFGDDADGAPIGAVVHHMLEVEYWHQDGSNESLFVALDEQDLHELRRVAARGIAKSKSLHRYLESIGLPEFNDGEAEGET